MKRDPRAAGGTGTRLRHLDVLGPARTLQLRGLVRPHGLLDLLRAVDIGSSRLSRELLAVEALAEPLGVGYDSVYRSAQEIRNRHARPRTPPDRPSNSRESACAILFASMPISRNIPVGTMEKPHTYNPGSAVA